MLLSLTLLKIRNLILFQLLSIIIIGGFLSFVFLTKTNSTVNALLIGYFYAFSIVLILAVVQKSVIKKLDVFTPAQQWILRTFIYTMSFSTAYLVGLLFQSAILEPKFSLTEFIGEEFWTSFVSFISSPLDMEIATRLFKEEYRTALIPFFAVIILIGLVSLIGSFVEMRWQQNKQQQAINKAELSALKAQIEPHFLFNSLNTIAAEINKAPDKAEQLIIKLSDILRYLFDNSSREMTTIKEEISFLKKYTDLLQARFDQKLKITWQNSLKNETTEIPVLLFQPLVENAIRHGWKQNTDPLTMTISIHETEESIVFTVRDDGQGIEPGRLQKLPVAGHALANIKERLFLNYNKENLMNIKSTYGQDTTVSIILPMRKS
jgi:signal transduction histidine kinase